jgi:hypothetical protein
MLKTKPPEEVIMKRKIYQLTASDQKKIDRAVANPIDWAAIDAERPADTKSKVFRKWSMRKRDLALRAMRDTAEYMRGKGQGALDLACGLPYAEKTDDTRYNCGYHNGYTNPSNLYDLKAYNPNFAFLREQEAK